MPSTSAAAASPTPTGDGIDPLAGVDTIVVIDNGAHNIRIASIPYPFASSSTSPHIDAAVLAQAIAVDVYPNAIARTRTPHTVAASTSPTAPAPGTKTSVFVSSHIHSLLDDYAALHLRLPHQSGVVVDWAAQKTIWDHVLTNHLAKLPTHARPGTKGKLLAGKAVLIAETYLNPEPAQYAADLLLFEHYGASAVWRTTPAALVGLGTTAFHTPRNPTPAAVDAEPSESAEPASKRPQRTVRSEAEADKESGMPRVLTPRRPQSMLVLDLGYSFCHAVPVVDGQVVYPAVRRLELGGKMLVNLLKETLSFQQLDMMDESWLVTHLFARTAFVAAEVGTRSRPARDRGEAELDRIARTPAAKWSYHDLLQLINSTKPRRTRVALTWRLPDYGSTADKREEHRDRARYGYPVDALTSRPRRGSLEEEEDWVSSFISRADGAVAQSRRPRAGSDDDDEEEAQALVLETERFSMLEHLFNPAALGLDQQGLAELVADAIAGVARSPHAPRRAAADLMWANIVLVGGLSDAVNLRRRLANELAPLAPADVPVAIVAHQDASRAAIEAGVVVACEIAADRAMRDQAEAGVGAKGKGKKRSRQSRQVDETGRLDGTARWMTYAQWMARAEGAAANEVFYPKWTAQRDHEPQ